MDLYNVINGINILAVIVSPIIAVYIGQKLQNRAQLRKDKMNIFQTLLTKRGIGWIYLDTVNALNSIDIVFSDNSAVRDQWKQLYNLLNVSDQKSIANPEVIHMQCKLLELMANDLGYKERISWGDIQRAYYPIGLQQQIQDNRDNLRGQAELGRHVEKLIEMGIKGSPPSQNV